MRERVHVNRTMKDLVADLRLTVIVHVVRTRDRWQLALLVLCLETLSVCQ